jgi:urate oxidase
VLPRGTFTGPMSVVLSTNQYGKSEVRMLAVDRDVSPHRLWDLTVSVALSGELEEVHETGDNGHVVATDTQKNTVFAFARDGGVGEIEQFALRLGRHFVSEFPPITRARVHITTAGWKPIQAEGAPHPHSFQSQGAELRTATAVCEDDGEWVVSGIEDLLVLKTSGSQFTGFIVDRYTTLQETEERILCTSVRARWRHSSVTAPDIGWDRAFVDARAAALERFAMLHSRSLQQSLSAMAAAILDAAPGTCEVRMSMPNRHHFLVDLQPFGLSNDNQVFRVEDRPYGLIEAAILRDRAPEPGPAWEPAPLI